MSIPVRLGSHKTVREPDAQSQPDPEPLRESDKDLLREYASLRDRSFIISDLLDSLDDLIAYVPRLLNHELAEGPNREIGKATRKMLKGMLPVVKFLRPTLAGYLYEYEARKRELDGLVNIDRVEEV